MHKNTDNAKESISDSATDAMADKVTGARAHKSSALSGTVRAPGDKSISHRSLIFGALAEGTTQISGLLEGADILSTAQAMQAFGAKVTRNDKGIWTVIGCGEAGWQEPDGPVDCGNAGTGVRLIMGAASAYPITVTYIGDESLSSRPMGRVTKPLAEMGVSATGTDGDKLPMTLTAPECLSVISYAPPQASAQVKSCLLLAGLGAKGTTEIHETHLTRDHTENMLRAFGCPVESIARDKGQLVRVTGPATLTATNVTVPGDPSSAAFAIVAALIVPGSDIVIENVMMNPTRIGLFDTLTEMGAYLRADNFRKSGGEVIADIHVKYSKLRGIVVPPARAASMIDEYPILTIAAAFASGTTLMDGIGELRVKESDRISATVALLKSAGIQVSETKTSMTVTGRSRQIGGGHVTTHHDHRIAMSALVLGLATDQPMNIDDASMIATSFPSFFELMNTLGAKMETAGGPI